MARALEALHKPIKQPAGPLPVFAKVVQLQVTGVGLVPNESRPICFSKVTQKDPPELD